MWTGASVARIIGVLGVLAVGLVGCGEEAPNVGDYWRYEATATIPQLFSQRTETFGMTVRIEEPEMINGREYTKAVALVTGRPGVEPTTTYTRISGKTQFTLREDRTTEVERPRELEVGDTFETAEGAQCEVVAREDVPLETQTYKNALKTQCSLRDTTMTTYTTEVGDDVKTVMRTPLGGVVEMVLVEKGNVNEN